MCLMRGQSASGSKPYRNEKLTKFLVAIAGSSRSVSRTISAMFVELLWVPYRSNGVEHKVRLRWEIEACRPPGGADCGT